MTQFESNDAILKGIISSQLGGSAPLQLQPTRPLIVAGFGAVSAPRLGVCQLRAVHSLGDTSPIHPTAAHASASLRATRCATEGQCVSNYVRTQCWCYLPAELAFAVQTLLSIPATIPSSLQLEDHVEKGLRVLHSKHLFPACYSCGQKI